VRRVAQLVEHRPPKPGVAGSIPASPAFCGINNSLNKEKPKRNRMINKLQQFMADVRFEMGKVSWPNWNELKGSTYVVLSLSLILIIYLFVVDFLLSKVLNIIL
tara:strand:- start:911 stop:1222 length:312 start_codon:yes stop_codon:yes gene_type:complete